MMKQTALLASAIFLALSTGGPQARAGDAPFPDTPKIRSATTNMLKSCKKEFSGVIPGMSINRVDHWAEAQERASSTISAPFKKTRCFASHEIWEKRVQRNEWASGDGQDVTRLPASNAQGTPKIIDGNQVPAWRGNQPIF